MRVIGLCIYLLQVSSYTYTFLINPGIPKKDKHISLNDTDEKMKIGYKYCSQCRILVEQNTNTQHCDDCNVCIEGIII
jgi:hypothetical protein